MKWTLERIAQHLAAMAEMRAHMRAVRIEDIRLAVFRPKQDEIAPEVSERLHTAHRQIVPRGYPEPTDRK